VKDTAFSLNWASTDNFRQCMILPENKYKTISTGLTSAAYGNYVRVGRLTYARIFGAGHMINENRGSESKHLFETWILNNKAFEQKTNCI
jgi:cathepsin A (carboxypeptidase C)